MPYADLAEQRRFQREWVAARRAEWLAANGPCKGCGGTTHLEVDHIDPGSKVDHKVWTWSEERRNAELAKCQVLCVDCHDAKTAADKRAAVEHGSITMYEKAGCRCEPCRLAKSLKNKRRVRNGSQDGKAPDS